MFHLQTNDTFTKKIVMSALLLSLALALKIFSFSIPIAGIAGIRIGFGGPFLAFIGILFGPFYAAIAYALFDIIGYLLAPQGAFLWPLTLVAFLKGFSVAFLWHFIKNVRFKRYNFVYLSIFIGILIVGIVNLVFASFLPISGYTQWLVSLGAKVERFSIGILVAGIVGLCLHGVAWLLLSLNKKGQLFEIYLKLLVCVGVPALVGTTVNTFILINAFSLNVAFLYFWIPRLIEEIFIILFNTYVLIALMSVYERVFIKKGSV